MAAVEFALVLPLLLLILFAILDLGWVFNQQLTLTQAAREGARHIAIHANDPGEVATAEARVTSIAGAGVTITYPSTCSEDVSDDEVTVLVEAPMNDLTGWLTAITGGVTMSGVGSMRCGG
ncbi:TadE/TadG family type IV pilus assembly protein [Agromyces arachidis]|uniref:TadE/TadG family type IV pilus assembly protein n=1 Tax=Agromyces arachidis TaxID=766966 RepID=UPI004057B0F5